MRRVVTILLGIVLAMGGLCSGLCLAQTTTDGPAHSCCHEKNHCGHAGPTMQPHQAVAAAQTVPVILTGPVPVSSWWVTAPGSLFQPHLIVFAPPLRTSVLRL